MAAKPDDGYERTTTDNGNRSARAVLALCLPAAALLLMVGEALTPKGLDKPTTTLSSALKALRIGAAHSGQIYVSNMLVIFGLGALGVSFAAIATLGRHRDAGIATAAAAIGGLAGFCGALANMLVGFNLAAAATAQTPPLAAAHVLVSQNTAPVTYMLLTGYLGLGFVAIILTGIALWRAPAIPRWLPLLFGFGLIVAAGSRPGVVAIAMELPFAIAMVLLAIRIWNEPAR